VDRNDYVTYWKEGSERDFTAMGHLFESGDYQWALFLGHLVIEKLLKACYVKQVGSRVPRTHNLGRIATEAGLSVEGEMRQAFDRLTTFNLEVRYPSLEGEFLNEVTRDYAAEQLATVREIRQWLLEILSR